MIHTKDCELLLNFQMVRKAFQKKSLKNILKTQGIREDFGYKTQRSGRYT